MPNQPTLTSIQLKQKQWRNLLILAGILMGGVGGLYWLLASAPNEAEKPKLETTTFSSPLDHVDTQSVWMERAENQLKEEQHRTEALKAQVEQIKNSPSATPENDAHYSALQQQVEALQKALDDKTVEEKPVEKMVGHSFAMTPGAEINSQNASTAGEINPGIDDDAINLTASSDTVPKKNSDSFVPAGAYVEAVMLGAADAPAGVMNQANPSPMLFRIRGEGTLPNHHKSHLKDCVVTAAVVGDISSERGEIRLERMSCTFPNGEIVEQPVEGTVFGRDAKNGVRGTPVWREGALLQRAFVAGTLSGFSNGISQRFVTNSTSPLGNTQTVNNNDMFKFGAAQGAASAMDKLADYNIRRAEQYHPVIQLSAGQFVDLVFLKGFYLDGQKHEETEQDHNNSPEVFTAVNNPVPPETNKQTFSGLTLSDKQMAKIAQHEHSMGWVQAANNGDSQ